MNKLHYKLPKDFHLHESFVNALLENAHRLTDTILRRCEMITREKSEKEKVRWEATPGFGKYRPWPSRANLLTAIRESQLK